MNPRWTYGPYGPTVLPLLMAASTTVLLLLLRQSENGRQAYVCNRQMNDVDE